MHHHGEFGGAFDGVDTDLSDDIGKAWQCLINTVLHQLLGEVGVGAELKGDGECQRAVGGGLAGDIEHIFDAVDLLFERGGDGFSNDLGAGAGKTGADLNAGGDDFRIFRDGQQGQADKAREENED